MPRRRTISASQASNGSVRRPWAPLIFPWRGRSSSSTRGCTCVIAGPGRFEEGFHHISSYFIILHRFFLVSFRRGAASHCLVATRGATSLGSLPEEPTLPPSRQETILGSSAPAAILSLSYSLAASPHSGLSLSNCSKASLRAH